MDRREYNDIYKNARIIQKRDICKICGKACTSFCKSHTLPQMILRNIKSEGKIGSAFWGIGNTTNPDCLKQNLGIKETGIFYEICDNCDNNFFQEYEDPQKIANVPNSLMLKLVALKTSLYYYHKYRIELKTMTEFLGGAIGKEIIVNNNLLYVDELEGEINDIKNEIKSKSSDYFHIIYWVKLNYVIPIAYQGLLELKINFSGNYIVNNSPEVYIMLFPLKDSSIVSLFCKNDKNTIDQIAFPGDLKDNAKLSLISNMVLLCSEDYYLNNKLLGILNKNEVNQLKKLCYCLEFTSGNNMKNIIKDRISAILYSEQYPNLMDENFQVK